jgi:hypothetical protein
MPILLLKQKYVFNHIQDIVAREFYSEADARFSLYIFLSIIEGGVIARDEIVPDFCRHGPARAGIFRHGTAHDFLCRNFAGTARHRP